jgi:alpha-amylase
MASYHPFCWITDYTNQTMVEQCWLGDSSVALADLNTESQSVIDYWNNWVRNVVSTYNVDLLRLDTVKHVPKAFWSQFIRASGVSQAGEVLDGDVAYVGAYQKEAGVHPFNYPIYYPLARAFNSTSGNLTSLINMVGSVKQQFNDPTLLGGFLNNHDNARFESWVGDKGVSGIEVALTSSSKTPTPTRLSPTACRTFTMARKPDSKAATTR